MREGPLSLRSLAPRFAVALQTLAVCATFAAFVVLV